jgi:hypothetical protein
MIRLAYVDTALQGLGLDVTTDKGVISARTVTPHGVLLIVDGVEYEITSNALAEIGRFWLAAAVHCGEPISD